MIATLIISVLTIVSIIVSILIFPTIKIGKIRLSTYWIIALLGASILLIFSLSPLDVVVNEFTSNSPINPIKILILFFSMTLISTFLDEFGLFKYLAFLAAKKAHGSQYLFFYIIYFLTSLLTIFTSNDVVILTLTPFICMFCKRSKINPLPYLVAEFVAANTWSLMFVIGNPTNIYLATSAGITFIEYFQVMAIPTVVAGVVEIIILGFMFHKKLKEPISLSHDDFIIENKLLLVAGIFVLLTCLIFLVIGNYINLEMWLISLIAALTLFIITFVVCFTSHKYWHDITHTVSRLPFDLIPFFLSMFVIVVSLNHQGISSYIATFLGNSNPILVYGTTSFLMCNVINNIPMSILYTNLASNLTGATYTQAIYASIVGSNIGAFLTPIGALAGIMFTNLVNQQDVKFSFIDFIKYGSIISIPVLFTALGMLYIVL
jgi:arsenical pump membrane protein